MSTNIEYNGAVIATVEGGNVATIPCKDKKMASDLVITVPEAESGGGGGITEVSTEAEMTALLESGEVGAIYKYVGETGIYENGALYTIEETPSAVTSSNGEVLTDSNGIVLVLKEE